jgi:hypothetical protein
MKYNMSYKKDKPYNQLFIEKKFKINHNIYHISI